MSTAKLNLIFVDDEPRVLDGLRRQFRAQRDQWDIRFADSGTSALAMLAERPADVVISDMRMPGLSGIELMRQVLVLYPRTVRFVLSGQIDQSSLQEDIGPIHQYLQKPCDTQVLCRAIQRTERLAGVIGNRALRGVATAITSLPPSNDTYRQLLAALSDEKSSAAVIGDIVARDPALTVKLVQLVNSAFFGLPRKVDSGRDAVTLLGLKTIHSIVITGRLFESLAAPGQTGDLLTRLWQQSLQTGEAASNFARASGASAAFADRSRLAGMLSLLGRAILLTSDPTRYRRMLAVAGSEGITLTQAEHREYGANQDDITAYALGLWGFSDDLVTAAAQQGHPSGAGEAAADQPLPFVHMARALDATSAMGVPDPVVPEMDYLAHLKLNQLWLEAAGERPGVQTLKVSA